MGRKSRSTVVLRNLQQEIPISQAETYDGRDDPMATNEAEVDAMNEDEVNGVEDLQISDDENVHSLPKSSDNNLIEIICPDGSKRVMKGRPTVSDVYGLQAGEKVIVPFDKEYKAPYTKAQSLLSSFLYKLVRKGTFAPLSILTWDNPLFDDYKMKMLQHVESKFSYPFEMRYWVLEKLNKGWRSYKRELKKIFDKFGTMSEARINVPDRVNPEQWNVLITDWSSNEKKKQCEINKQNAAKNKFPHTLGRKSFIRKTKEMEEENGKIPDRLQFFEVSHKRKDGSFINEESMQKTEEAKRLRETVMQEHGDESVVVEEVYKGVFGPEHGGRVRGLGLGPKPREYFGTKISRSSDFLARETNNELVESLKKQISDLITESEKDKKKLIRYKMELRQLKESHEAHEKAFAIIRKKYEKYFNKLEERQDLLERFVLQELKIPLEDE